MASYTYGQIYGAEGVSGGDDVTAVRPGDGESSSTFDIAEYANVDKTPALAIVAIIAALVGIRLLWERAS